VGRGLEAKLLNMINSQLEAHGLIVRQGAIVDAPIVESSRRPRKIETIEPVDEAEDDASFEVNKTYSDDVEAKWTIKANKPYYDLTP
jgi:IS5 family transposase